MSEGSAPGSAVGRSWGEEARLPKSFLYEIQKFWPPVGCSGHMLGGPSSWAPRTRVYSFQAGHLAGGIHGAGHPFQVREEVKAFDFHNVIKESQRKATRTLLGWGGWQPGAAECSIAVQR